MEPSEEYPFEEIEKQAEISLTPNEIEDVDQIFMKFDVDNNGYLDTLELRSVLEALGQRPTEEDVMRLINLYAPEGEYRICIS